MRVTSIVLSTLLVGALCHAGYVNFETAHVHPIDLTPSGNRLLVVNTPDAALEVFAVQPDGSLLLERTVRVGLEPITVVARSDAVAWVVNNLSDSISIVNLDQGVVIDSFDVGDEPTDVVFAANGAAFVAVSSEDVVKVYIDPGPTRIGTIQLFSRDVRALSLSPDGTTVYAVTLRSGNQTATVHSNIAHDLTLIPPGALGIGGELHEGFYERFDLGRPGCLGDGPPVPPGLPAGIERNPGLTDPDDSTPKNGVIVQWREATGKWIDEDGSDWTHCVRFRLPDDDLFAINTVTWEATPVSHLGTALFDVSVNPANGKIYVPNTNARNFIRFEHPLGLRGHFVDNRLSIVDPAQGNMLKVVDLNAHIDRQSDPTTNLAERTASIAQPGMMAWKSDGSVAYMTALGSHKVFRVNGSCASSACIVGNDRATPDAADVGLGPSGVVLRETAQPEDDRLYVVNRISHSVTVLAAQTLQVLEEIPLHDPSSAATRNGRRFLYEAAQGSAHGDASCSSCHLFGDMDGLAWELGDPEAEMVSYDEPSDNLRFIRRKGDVPIGSSDTMCDPPRPECAGHEGFDPQKGPMVTQTLRGLIEPLHWRGDRPTFRDFNQTFVLLQGTANTALPGETPAALPASAMEEFRQFALEIRLPPNPHRNIDDTLPCGRRVNDPDCEVAAHGNLLPGNPTEGDFLFHEGKIFWNQSFADCTLCHQSEFGTFGGKLGGIEPTEPVSLDVARVRHGTFRTEWPILHNDIKVPQLRNLYEKFGPNPSPSLQLIDAVAGFGYTHDGSIPDMLRFATTAMYGVSEANDWQTLRDLVAFLFTFPSGTKPAVGRQVTLPPGTAPSGSAEAESVLSTLVALGDLLDPQRHCELVATTLDPSGPRSWAYSGASWLPDTASENPRTMQALREGAQSPITFTCGTIDSGLRLGGDRDEDAVRDGDDCAPADPGARAEPQTVAGLTAHAVGLSWAEQASTAGPGVGYDVFGGLVSDLAGSGVANATCLEIGLDVAFYSDPRPDPAPDNGYLYLVRASNTCGTGSLGPGREGLSCP